MSAQQGEKECLSWDGKDSGNTLGGWPRVQLRWQMRTPAPPEQWGVLLLEALPVGTLSGAMTDTVLEQELLTTEGYILIHQKILQTHQAHLEAELEQKGDGGLFLSETYGEGRTVHHLRRVRGAPRS